MVVVNDDVGRGGVVGARQNDFMGNGICEELCTLSLNVDEERLGSVKKEEEPGKIGTPKVDEDDQGDGRTDNGMCEQLSALSIKGEEEQLVSVKEEEEPGKIGTPNAEDDDQGYERTGNGMCEQLSSLPIKGDEEWLICEKRERDPRKIARQYQIDICRKALEENVVVYLGTGCGKTHIAVLLIYEMGHLIKKPQKNICIFLAPTVALVQQQAKVIHDSLDFKVGTYYGNSTHLRSRIDCEKELEEKEIFVMTPQIMLHCLSHCLIKIELIALLIFDECHYAQLGSNHPYAEIMKIFYKVDAVKLPRIFGMTASPKLGKGATIDGLEALLRAKVYSVEDKSELGKFVTSPKVNIYYYCSSRNACSSPHMTYLTKLEEIKRQSISGLQVNSLDQSILRSTKKLLQRLHSNLIFCLEGLGLWGALQASYNFSKNGYHCENGELVEEEESYGDENLCKKYLQRASSVLASECAADGMEGDLSSVEVLKEPYFSRKLLQLIAVLSNFRLQPNMKCIIFVNRIVTARSLSYIIQNLKLLSSWRCEFLVGVHSGFMSHNTTNAILEKFRSGELNLLVATKVGEEGLDIQTCCLVIRFDLPETVASFIQSRGRARMPNSEYAFLVDRDNPHELNLIEHFKEDEAQMNEEISSRNSKVPITEFEEKTYKVDLTGATISSVSSVSLLHHYCSKLPHDEYFNPKPQFFYYEAGDGMVCNIVFPANAPIHQIVGAPQASIEAAKKDACLEACRNLHQVGALTDYLLPEEYDKSEKSTIDSADSDGNYEDSRAELHEMLVPAALTKPWTEVADSTCFSSYSVKLCPNPADRVYRKFGLFVTEPLPEEAGKMKLDLCLAHGRMVMTQLVPSGVAIFDKDEIAAAEMFQKICLKVVLDRNAFTPKYVPLENNDVYEPSTSTFYLLLPIVKHEYGKISVDWKLVKRFLSSPIFKQPHSSNSVTSQPGSCLHLANGCRSIQDVVDGLVYVPGKDVFFFVSDILQEKNGYSLFDESRTHVEYYAEVFGIHLVHPNQPLLRAKQLFILDNLLRKKKHKDKWREKEEHFVELPPEVCQLKVIGFSKDIGSSFSLLPSIMHRLESFLVAIELKDKLGASFPEGKEVTADRILEAITTAKCCEHFSLERLEVLGDAFLKLAVSRHLFLKHDALDEGQLTRKRSNLVNNSNLHRLAIKNNLQVYIRDYSLEVDKFFAFGRRCPISCDKETEGTVHSQSNENKNGGESEVRCNRCHHFLHNKTIADVVEALVGAFLIDSGFKAATGFLNWVGIDVDLSCSQIDNICSASNSFMALSNKIDVNPLENLLRCPFRHKGLLIQAFVHPSFNSHLGGCYQRLEFLGDAVLDYLITSYLYSVFPNLNPGRLTDLKSLSVNNVAFADVAARLSFHKFIICDSSVLRESMAKYVDTSPSAAVKDHIEERSCPKALGDLVESCIGAIYLDTGFDLSYVWKTMLFLLHPVINFSKLQFNPVRELVELCQSYNWQVEFASLKGDGKFRVEAKVNEKNVSSFATHTSGKAAKKMAARQVYDLLEAEGYRSKTKSLDEVLRKSKKREPRLLGYDETPFYRTPKCEVLENSEGDCNMKVYALNEKSSHTSCPVREHPSQDTVSPRQKQKFHQGGSKTDPPSIDLNTGRCSSTQGKTGSVSNVSSKSRLYEICTANCWKAPVFECVQEAGPDHVKEFIFRITIEIEETETGIVEIYSEARNRKKDAAENAAEGALWYLKHQGYT